MSVRFSVPRPRTTAIRVLLFFLVCALLLTLTGPIASRFPGQWSQVALGSIASAATVMVTAIFLRWDRLRFCDVGVAPGSGSTIRVLAGFALGLLLVALQTGFVMLAGHVHWVRSSSVSSASVGIALLTYTSLAVREELAFRGYPLRRLNDQYGALSAQVAVGLVFALEHVVGGATWANAMFGAFVGSLLFGMAALAMRGLAVPVGVHAAWNFGQWILGEKETSGLWTPIVEPGYKLQADHVGMIGYLMVFGVATLAFYQLGHLQRQHEPGQPMEMHSHEESRHP